MTRKFVFLVALLALYFSTQALAELSVQCAGGEFRLYDSGNRTLGRIKVPGQAACYDKPLVGAFMHAGQSPLYQNGVLVGYGFVTEIYSPTGQIWAGSYTACPNPDGTVTATSPTGRTMTIGGLLPVHQQTAWSMSPVATRSFGPPRPLPQPQMERPEQTSIPSILPHTRPMEAKKPTPATEPQKSKETGAVSPPKPNASPPAGPILEEFTIKIPVERIAVGNSIEINGRKFTKKAEGLIDDMTQELYRGEAWAVVEVKNGEISAPKQILSQRPHLKELPLPM